MKPHNNFNVGDILFISFALYYSTKNENTITAILLDKQLDKNPISGIEEYVYKIMNFKDCFPIMTLGSHGYKIKRLA